MEKIHIFRGRDKLMNLQNNMVLQFCEGVHYREEEFGLLVVSNSTPAIVINRDGEYVWHLIDGRRTVKEVIELTRREYKGDVEQGVIELLDKLVKIGICQIKE